MPPNVLLVVLDAARRDALEPYGAPGGSTPTIAQLARRGRALAEVYATACWTVPSHASIFTGLMPRAAGLSRVPSPAAARPVVEAQRDRLLPAVLGRAGYSTAAVSANFWVSAASGLSEGFDEFVSVDTGRHAHHHAKGRRARLRWLAEAAQGRVDDGARDALEIFDRWIGAPPGRPFFWFVNLVECHSPYLPPRPYGDVSLLERLRAAEDARNHYHLDGIWRSCVGGSTIPDTTLERMRRLYHGAIRYMDDWLAQLLERLDGAGVLEDTLVIVTSDHGENFGEGGGLLTHALSLDNRLIHVPFVLAGPGSERAAITSLAEVPRLVAEAAGLTEHPWREPLPAGVGVAQFDPPADPGDPRAAEAVERWGLGADAERRLTTALTCAVAGDLKVLDDGGREEVYDLAADPLEVAPVSADALPPERGGELTRLREALRHPAVTARRAGATSGEPPGPGSADEIRELEERMRLLGYM